MEHFIWLLYLADACSSLSATLVVVATISTIVIGVLAFGNFLAAGDTGDRDRKVGFIRTAYSCLWFLVIPLLFAVIASVLPSSATVYMITAVGMSRQQEQSIEFRKVRAMLDYRLQHVYNEDQKANK